ncbi:ABC transporter ATP-binding protein [Silanimonas sp.]|jgi:ABC-2 type transport system ATP-binding protein|uniref:ABC transporter ATP-binding protein n=1 Tax=Silanimonas sp. TaxID=1929290 RepID=UPI0037CA3E23
MTATPSPIVARLEGVTHRYGGLVALDGVDLDIHSGEVLALLGANGAGKTTALGLLTGLLRPQQGRVELCGGDPRAASSRRALGVMLQEARLPETLRVGELVRQFSAAYPSARPEAETLALAGLHGLERRPYGALSGGQQRRVQFALAICGRPRIVLVDEPTTGLDVEARRAFWAVLRGLRLEGAALVLTTHYLEEADALADRVVVMHAGRTVAEGTPMQLKARSGGTRVRCRSALGLDEVRMLPGVSEAHREGERLVLRCSDADAAIRALLRRDPTLADFQVVPASLEDSLLELTHRSAA